MNLTSVIYEEGASAIVHRLDRFSIGYQSGSNVIKLGRQAISWGNGVMFRPMDFLNPFDPSAIDKEYKTGDDMVYAQHLFANGNDLQLVWGGRRNTDGKLNNEHASLAGKLHAFVGASEIDVLIGKHYNDTVIAIGGVFNAGEGLVRADVVLVDTTENTYVSAVANYNYSWTAFDLNMSAVIEYIHKDFGVSNGEYTAKTFTENPELGARLVRGELYSLGQDYLGVSLLTELSPLWLAGSNLFYNINDYSSLVQVVSRHDLSQNSRASIALSLPIGAYGSEYGGISISDDPPTTTEWSLYAQWAWYF